MSGARTRRIARIRAAMPFTAKLAELSVEAHKGLSFRIDRDSFTSTWYATPFTQTRDADALEESNWAVISEDLDKRFPESVEVHSFGHFACGYYERLYVRTDDALAIRAIQDWVERLENHPVASDDHYSEVEWERNHPSEHECYSEDPDCGCEKNTHSCREQLWGAVERAGAIDLTAESYWCRYCNGHIDMTDADRAEMLRRLYGRRKWSDYSRADFDPQAAAKHANAQERYRREVRAWQERGQLDLFSDDPAPTVDDLIELTGL
ncbi:hypothetical protein [Kitasatospora sp. NPDC096204]|uniref:hypothetical protein n=1 Tax=Kitasatospora sp. NPDC096204 TaxID=3364094 RepID=UPI00380EA411